MDNIPIYWINLNRSPDRKEVFEKQLEFYNIINHYRIEGIDGIDINLKDYKNNIQEYLTKFELGCTLSHLKAIKESFNNNEEYALIMEDDCSFEYLKFQKYTITDLINIMNNDYNDWELLQLVTCNRSDHNQNLLKNNNYICKKFRNCTTCYLINKKGIQKIINSNIFFKQADYFIYENVNSYYLTKPYFSYNYSNKFISTVHNMGDESNKTIYSREDNNKKFWDNYYFNPL